MLNTVGRGYISAAGAQKTNVIILHPTINQRGGAEKVCVRIIEALYYAGHDVTLYTIEKTKWKAIEADWGASRRPREVWCLKDQRYTRLPLLRWPLFLMYYLGLLVKAAKKKGFVSLNNYGEILPLFVDISYVHSLPLSASSGNPFSIPLWNNVKPLYHALLRLFSNYTSALILTNSKYNRGRIASQHQVMVLYPPVDRPKIRDMPKSPSILTTSRFSRSKRLEIIPKIADLVSTRCEFNICLTINSDESLTLPLQGSNINVFANPSAEKLDLLRQTSTIYLSTQPTEAFGLSILEAMAVGCIPVVPRDGGPWADILEENQGEAGFAYDSPIEAAEQIDTILNDAYLAEKLAKAVKKRARKFQGNTFTQNLLRILTVIDTKKKRNV